eukprot:m.45663 g.45663  ORF g.45663 m.45663 type:complete len:82 (-) comp11031_c0_seq4:984-1229(-)
MLGQRWIVMITLVHMGLPCPFMSVLSVCDSLYSTATKLQRAPQKLLLPLLPVLLEHKRLQLWMLLTSPRRRQGFLKSRGLR